MSAISSNDDELDDRADPGGTDDDDVDEDSLELDPAQLDAAAEAGDLSVAGDAAEDVSPGSLAPYASAFRVDVTTGAVSDQATASAPAQVGLTGQLSGNIPLLLLAKSYQLAEQLPSVARVAARVTAGQIGVGVVVRLPPHSAAAAGIFLARFPGSLVRLADPDLYRAPSHGSLDNPISNQMVRRHPWLANAPAPSAPTDLGWVTTVLEKQADAGATVLLSATGWLGSANGARELGNARRWVAASRTAAASTPMFVNLTMDSTWLTTPTLRSALLEELVESNERLWYLRFRWPVVEPRYGQLRQAAVLDGYKELAVTAALEGKVLVLPNSGLTGWVATALGGTGFSTGTSWGEQAYAAPRIMASAPGRPKPPATLRLFERTILHTVDHASHVALLGESNYLLCQCRYCQSIGARTTSSARWNKETAALHYLLRCARLTAMLNSPSRRMEALREVRRARQFVRGTVGTPAAPTGNNAPAHLSEWERLLL